MPELPLQSLGDRFRRGFYQAVIFFLASGCICGCFSAKWYLLQPGATASLRQLFQTEPSVTATFAQFGTICFTLLLFLSGLLHAGRGMYFFLFFLRGFLLGYVLNCAYYTGGYTGLLRLLSASCFGSLLLLPAQLYAACILYGFVDRRLKTPSRRMALCVYIWFLSATLAAETFLLPLLRK